MTDSHGRGDGPREEPLTDPSTRAPTHAERARTLVSSRTTGALSTLAKDPPGYPHGSFVTFAMCGSDPVFFLSTLAVHTQHLLADPRASLLVTEERGPDPLASARVTLLGDCTHDTSEEAREAYLAAHPSARHYASMSDFGIWRLSVKAIRYIGGFGRMSWVGHDAWQSAEPDPIAPHADGILEHMNADHESALVAYARAFTRAARAERASMTSIDRYGFELSVVTEHGPRPARIAFEPPIGTAAEARERLVTLARRARTERRE